MEGSNATVMETAGALSSSSLFRIGRLKYLHRDVGNLKNVLKCCIRDSFPWSLMKLLHKVIVSISFWQGCRLWDPERYTWKHA